MASQQPERIEGIMLNDIGPEVDPRGIKRINDNVGGSCTPMTLEQAKQRMQELNGHAYLDLSDAEWNCLVRMSYRQNEEGFYFGNYDPLIAKALQKPRHTNFWLKFSVIRQIKMMLLHGEVSDLLTWPIVARMQQENPAMLYVAIPNRGHTPLLNEPIAVEAIHDFLQQID